MVKRRRIAHPRCEIRKVPKQPERLEHARRTVRLGLAGYGVRPEIFDEAGGGERGDEPGWHAAAEAVEVEGVRFAVECRLGVRLVVGAHRDRGGHVVVEAAALVVREHQERVVPVRALAHGVVDLLHEHLAVAHVPRRVHRVGVPGTAARVEVGELGEEAEVRVLEEVLDGDNVVGRVGGGPGIEERVGREGAVGAVVVEPGDIVRGGGLEDAVDIYGSGFKVVVVRPVPVGRARERAGAVRVCGLQSEAESAGSQECSVRRSTHPGNAREPVVERREPINEVHYGGDLLLVVVSHHLRR